MDAAKGVLASFDAIAETSPRKPEWACASGCSYCCHMPVHLTAVEAVAIAAYVYESFDVPARADTAQRLASTAEAIAPMSDAEFKDSRNPCALLDDEGRCSVYEARPLACRGFHSTSAEVCQASFESNDTRCDAARDRGTEDVCARMVVAMHAVSRAGSLGDRRFELNSAVARLVTPGASAVPDDVVAALEGARAKPSPLDVPLNAIIARFRDP
jgi:Fe-S-cluster containining protein